MNEKTYPKELLDKTYDSLSADQKLVLDEHVIRGKKTKWLNVWAKKLGRELTDEELNNPDQPMQKYLVWRLIGFEDSLMINPNTKCECGRSLRYRYTVENVATKKTYKLGIKHLQDHMGLSPELVKAIAKGLNVIDLEKDELLTKIINHWTIPIEIPANFKLPSDIISQLRVNLPLLDRQVSILREQLFGSKSPRSGIPTRPRFKFEPIKKEVKEVTKAPELTNADPHFLIERLKAATINTTEAKALLDYISYYSGEELKRNHLSLDDIGKFATRALARISDPVMRGILIDIETFVQYGFY